MQNRPLSIPASKGRTRHQGMGHLKSLDGVRGLAILMVVFSHLFQADYEHSSSFARAIGNTLHYGSFGVDLFFVLSGFLITGILVDSIHDSGFFRKFYARRVLRIFPLYYGVLLVLFALTPLLHLAWNGMGLLLVLYFQNLRPEQIMSFSPGDGFSLNHFWSLAVEEQFYLVWPALIFVCKTHSRVLRLTLILSVCAFALRIYLLTHGGSYFSVHANTLCRADSLLLGGTCALFFRRPSWAFVTAAAPYGFGLMAIVIGLSFALTNNAWFHSDLWLFGVRYTVLALASCSLVAWSLSTASWVSRFFQLSALRFFGKYSYGIYVLHLILLSAILGNVRPWITSVTHSKIAGVVVSAAVALVFSVGAAVLSFHLFEKHFLRLKKYFDYDAPVA